MGGGGDKGGQAGTGGIGSQIHVKASWNADGSSASVQVGNNHYSGEWYDDVMSPPSPTPPSPPSPGCPGGSLSSCMRLCPGDPVAFQACVKECSDRCASEAIV